MSARRLLAGLLLLLAAGCATAPAPSAPASPSPPASPAPATPAAHPGRRTGTLGAVDLQNRTVVLGDATYTFEDPDFFEGWQAGDPVQLHVEDGKVLSVEPETEQVEGFPQGELMATLGPVDLEHRTVALGPPLPGDFQARGSPRLTFRDPEVFRGFKSGDRVRVRHEGGVVVHVEPMERPAP